MAIIWKASISPTLIDIADSYAVAASTPWGTDPANFFFQICNDKSLGWVEMHARSEDNPYLPRESSRGGKTGQQSARMASGVRGGVHFARTRRR